MRALVEIPGANARNQQTESVVRPHGDRTAQGVQDITPDSTGSPLAQDIDAGDTAGPPLIVQQRK